MVLCIAKLESIHLARRWHLAANKVVELGAPAPVARRLSLDIPLCAVGIASVLRDSWPGAPHLGVNLHAIFGAMLWLMAVAQFSYASLSRPPLGAAGVHELCRRLSRRIYLFLYLLFGVSLLVRMAAILWNSGHPGASHSAILPPPDNLRDYLAYGVFALLTLHALAAAQRQALKRLVAH